MNEEEAIEYIEQFIGIKKEYKCKPIKVKTLNNTREAIETVLNLIQTQQAEIEKKDKESHFIQSKLDEANAEIIKLKRMIDLMSEQLTTPLHSKAWVKEYFERKVENGTSI